MAQIVIPDETLLRAPELWVPGRKPVGPVTVDWSHPLATGLVGAWYFGAGKRVDLVRFGRIDGANNTPEFTPFGLKTENTNECAWTTSDTGLEGKTSASLVIKVAMSGAQNTDASVLRKWRGGSQQLSFGVDDGNSSITRTFFRGANGQYLERQWSTSYSTDGTFDTFGVTWGGSSSISVYFNGVEDNGAGSLGTPDSLPDVAEYLTFMGRYDGNTPDSFVNGVLEFVWIFARGLSEAEHAEMARDPYQFLIPA